MTQKKRTGLIVALCIVLALVVIGGVLGIVIFKHLENLPILPNIKVAGVDVGGMTVSQATEAVQKAIGNDYASKDITLQVFDETVTISAAYCGGTLDVEKAVKAARNFGQVGFPGKLNEEKQIAAAGYNVNLEPYMQIDKNGIMQVLNKVAAKYDSSLTQTSWVVVGNKPTDEELAAGNVNMQLIVTMGTAKYDVNPEVLYNQVIEAYSNRNFTIQGNCTKTEPGDVDVDAILSQHAVAAQDAYLDETTFKVVDSKYGYGFDAESAKQLISAAQFGEKVTISFARTEPELTTQEMQDRMFADTLATFTAESSSNSGRKSNLKLACKAVDGIILNPGEVFDYNKTLGQRTTARGYKPANAYLNGETVQTVGGGICQVSSTIYYCALMADLEIVTRRNHSYPSSYIPLGMDATVSWGGPEFRFKNNYKYPIKIVATANGGDTTVSIMSYDDRDYYVKMEYEVLKKTGYSVVYKDFAHDNAEGYKDGQVISTPYTGYVVDTYRVYYSKETNKEISRTYEGRSTYKHRDKVIARVAAAPVTPEPTPGGSTGEGSGVTGGDILDMVP